MRFMTKIRRLFLIFAGCLCIALCTSAQQFNFGADSPMNADYPPITAANVGLLREIGRLIREVPPDSLAFSHDGNRLAVGYMGGTVSIYELESGSELLSFDSEEQNGPFGRGNRTINSLAFSPDDTLLAVGGADVTFRSGGPGPLDSLQLWDPIAGRQQAILLRDGTISRSIAFSPDGALLAAADSFEVFRLWDTRTWTEYIVIDDQDQCTSVAFNTEGDLLACGFENGEIHIWSIGFWRYGLYEMEQAILKDGHRRDVTDITFNPDGTMIASGSRDGTIRLWDIETGTNQIVYSSGPTRGDGQIVSRVAFNLDGSLLVSSSARMPSMTDSLNIQRDDSVHLWDVHQGKEVAVLTEDALVTDIAFSPDGSILAYSCWHGVTHLWAVPVSP